MADINEHVYNRISIKYLGTAVCKTGEETHCVKIILFRQNEMIARIIIGLLTVILVIVAKPI